VQYGLGLRRHHRPLLQHRVPVVLDLVVRPFGQLGSYERPPAALKTFSIAEQIIITTRQ
jgi:hypothetical protein